MQELYPYLIPGIAFSAGAGLAIAEHIYWERIYLRRTKKGQKKISMKPVKIMKEIIQNLNKH